METDLDIRIDRGTRVSLTKQISSAISTAIRAGRLSPGARLPSWYDLAVQLGVSRGTVRMAYDILCDQQLITAHGAAGTHVASHTLATVHNGNHSGDQNGDQNAERIRDKPLEEVFPGWPVKPGVFQVGVPAQDVFPFKTWSRIMGRAARTAAARQLGYPDPRGELELRSEISAYLAIARGIDCTPAQVFITSGFAGALGVALRALQMEGKCAWMEEPGFSTTRETLVQSGVTPIPVAVDAEGLDVTSAWTTAPQAKLAIVTAGQQAPLGVTLSLRRRHALLDWAERSDSWIIEDDYLGELQLQGRAAPALASLDRNGRVLHIGTFSKTITPSLRVGFIVVPNEQVARMENGVTTYASAPAPSVQLAVAEFMHRGHYLRHLRRMKRVYADRRTTLGVCLGELSIPYIEAGLAVLIRLPEGVRDTDIAVQARTVGLSPSALSWWYAQPKPGYDGLLLGVTNLPTEQIAGYCKRLTGLWSQ
ncbi:PLP-dependent aminotransferase family protein [Undibacterium sp. Ji50W]|uniref:MocR-like pyridoxine biosynthesis transcription factor PdxR n=1 Tax=Undibacterium sp. Ji50W TaxID=3413041 RepID=UPI003BF28676